MGWGRGGWMRDGCGRRPGDFLCCARPMRPSGMLDLVLTCHGCLPWEREAFVRPGRRSGCWFLRAGLSGLNARGRGPRPVPCLFREASAFGAIRSPATGPGREQCVSDMYSIDMSLTQALLGLLAVEPASGYELTKEFEGDLGQWAWQAAHPSVYPELVGWLNAALSRSLKKVLAGERRTR